MTDLFKKVGVWIQIWYGKMTGKFVSQTPQIPFHVWPTTLSPPKLHHLSCLKLSTLKHVPDTTYSWHS